VRIVITLPAEEAMIGRILRLLDLAHQMPGSTVQVESDDQVR
jgi:hypothetical protein